MSKRFGRNQRRKMRDIIARQADLIWRYHRNVHELQDALNKAEDRAFQRYAEQHDLLTRYLDRIGIELGRALGAQLTPHAMKLMEVQRERPTLSARAHHFAKADDTVTILTGTIPSLHYKMAVR